MMSKLLFTGMLFAAFIEISIGQVQSNERNMECSISAFVLPTQNSFFETYFLGCDYFFNKKSAIGVSLGNTTVWNKTTSFTAQAKQVSFGYRYQFKSKNLKWVVKPATDIIYFSYTNTNYDNYRGVGAQVGLQGLRYFSNLGVGFITQTNLTFGKNKGSNINGPGSSEVWTLRIIPLQYALTISYKLY